MRFTSLDPLAVKILYMAKRIEKAPAPRVGGEPEPTEMGRRILGFMGAYRITNHADFAENVLGISRQRFHAWLYKKIDPENIAAQPILKCAEALGHQRGIPALHHRRPARGDVAHVPGARAGAGIPGPFERQRPRAAALDRRGLGGTGDHDPSTSAPFRIPLPAETAKDQK
jgi:hypothetical protein